MANINELKLYTEENSYFDLFNTIDNYISYIENTTVIDYHLIYDILCHPGIIYEYGINIFVFKRQLMYINLADKNQQRIDEITLECHENIKDNLLTVTIRPEDIKISQSENEKNILKGTIKELEFLGSNIRGHIEVDFESEKANVICNFASEYILNNNIQNNSSVSISLQPHALKIVKT